MPKNKKQKVESDDEEQITEIKKESSEEDSSSSDDSSSDSSSDDSSSDDSSSDDSSSDSDSSDEEEKNNNNNNNNNNNSKNSKTTKNDKKDDEESSLNGTIDENTVFVGQLPRNLTSEKLRGFFSGCGKTKRVIIMKFKDTKKQMGSAFVEFYNPQDAEKACGMTGKKFEGKVVVVNMSKNKPSSSGPSSKATPTSITSKTVYVGNLNFQTNKDTLQKKFQKCGKIANINLPYFHDTQRRRGFAMIQFETDTSVLEALKLHGMTLDHREIVVQRVSSNKGTKAPKDIPESAKLMAERVNRNSNNNRKSQNMTGNKRKDRD